jgi:hypothetical protein
VRSTSASDWCPAAKEDIMELLAKLEVNVPGGARQSEAKETHLFG